MIAILLCIRCYFKTNSLTRHLSNHLVKRAFLHCSIALSHVYLTFQCYKSRLPILVFWLSLHGNLLSVLITV